VHWVLARPDVFLNSSSDGRTLEPLLAAAAATSDAIEPPSNAEMETDARAFGIEPLFLRDISDAI